MLIRSEEQEVASILEALERYMYSDGKKPYKDLGNCLTDDVFRGPGFWGMLGCPIKGKD